jgi:hypothetical protein
VPLSQKRLDFQVPGPSGAPGEVGHLPRCRQASRPPSAPRDAGRAKDHNFRQLCRVHAQVWDPPLHRFVFILSRYAGMSAQTLLVLGTHQKGLPVLAPLVAGICCIRVPHPHILRPAWTASVRILRLTWTASVRILRLTWTASVRILRLAWTASVRNLRLAWTASVRILRLTWTASVRIPRLALPVVYCS